MNHKIGGTETDSHYMFYIKNNIYGKEKGYPDGMKGLEDQNYQYVVYPVGDFLCHTVSTGNLREEITFDSQDRPISKTMHEYTYSYSNSKYGYIPVNAIDPDGKEKIEFFSYKEKNDNVYLDFDKFNDDPNVLNIWAHGNAKGVFNRKIGMEIKSADEFIEYILSKSVLWKNHNVGNSLKIVLHSCETAEFAKLISEDPRLKDVEIIAPNNKINVFTSKDVYNKDGKKEDKKYYGAEIETIRGIKGEWKSYKNGLLDNSFSGEFKTNNESKPGAVGFYISEIYYQCYFFTI